MTSKCTCKIVLEKIYTYNRYIHIHIYILKGTPMTSKCTWKIVKNAYHIHFYEKIKIKLAN